MKKLKILFALLVATVLSSCVDTEEKIVINKNNAGIYSMTVDLGRMLKMAGSLGGEKTGTDKVKEKKDTIVYLKDMVKAADNLTPAEKALYKNGMIHISLDEEQNKMKIVISTPFKNTADLTEIKNNFSTVMNKIKAFEKATGEKEGYAEDGDDLKKGTKSPNPVADQFTFKAAAGRISNTIINLDAFKKKVAADSTLSMMTQMTSMMGDLNYRTIIVLPKTIKKYDGPGSTISTDKKTLTFFTTLAEILQHPEKASYHVQY